MSDSPSPESVQSFAIFCAENELWNCFDDIDEHIDRIEPDDSSSDAYEEWNVLSAAVSRISKTVRGLAMDLLLSLQKEAGGNQDKEADFLKKIKEDKKNIKYLSQNSDQIDSNTLYRDLCVYGRHAARHGEAPELPAQLHTGLILLGMQALPDFEGELAAEGTTIRNAVAEASASAPEGMALPVWKPDGMA